MSKNEIIRGPGVTCPHCDGTAELRTSRGIQPLVRDLYYRCRDEWCGHTFVAQLVVTHTIVASARPNPSVMLPTYSPPKAKPKPANDDTIPLVPANDDDEPADVATVVTAPS